MTHRGASPTRFADLGAKNHEVYILGFFPKKLTYANTVKHELEHR
jgi:hypothetical protein